MKKEILNKNQLNLIEKLGLLQNEITSYNEVVSVGFKFDIAEEVLIASMETATKEIDILHSYIRLNPSIHLVKDPKIEFQYQNIGIVSDDKLNHVIREQYEKEFDLNSGPVFRLVKLECDGNSTLIFTFNHVLADGISVASIVICFINILLSKLTKKLTVSVPEILCQHDRVDPFPLSAEKIELLDSQIKKILATPSVSKFKSMGFITKELNKENTTKLIEYCNSEGIGVHNAILSAMSIALFSHYATPPSNIQVRSIINLRSSFGAKYKNLVGDYHGSISGMLDTRNGMNFLEISKMIKREFSRSLRNKEQFIKLSNELELTINVSSLKDYKLINQIEIPTVTASSMGEVKNAYLQRLVKSVIPITSFFSGPEVHFHVFNMIINDKLILSFQYDRDALSTGEIEDLVAKTINFLEKIKMPRA